MPINPEEYEIRRRLSPEKKHQTQADRIIMKFRGVPGLLEALAAVGKPRDKATVYRWNHSHEKNGSGGIIPTTALPDVLAAARYAGVFLTAEDLDPRPTLYKIDKATKFKLRDQGLAPTEDDAAPEDTNP